MYLMCVIGLCNVGFLFFYCLFSVYFIFILLLFIFCLIYCFLNFVLFFAVYRGEDGKPYCLPVVMNVERAMAQDKALNHEYLPITGMKDLCDAATKLALGDDNTVLTQNRVS